MIYQMWRERSTLPPLKLMTGHKGFQTTLLTSNLESYLTSPVPYGRGFRV